MNVLQSVHASAQQADDQRQVSEQLRETAIRVARTGAPLAAVELAAIVGIKPATFYANAKRGLYDVFKVNPPLGHRCYSGVLVCRWLDGEPLYVPTFGRRKRG
jgi:hypothetical protein